MIIAPYNENENEEKPLRVRLFPSGRGVEVSFVDGDGEPEDTILSINENGIERYEDVAPEYRLPLDEGGRVALIHEPLRALKPGLRVALTRLKDYITDDDDYDDATTLDKCLVDDLSRITVGQLRIIVNALEKRL